MLFVYEPSILFSVDRNMVLSFHCFTYCFQVRELVGKVLASQYPEEVPQLYVPTYYYHIVPDHKIAENEVDEVLI